MASEKQPPSRQASPSKPLPEPAALEQEALPRQTNPATILQRARLNPGALTAQDVMQLQRTVGNRAVNQLLSQAVPPRSPLQNLAAGTGLPEDLKTGVERLSGLAMDDVRVHYNSDRPAGVQALAYTEGTDIHVAPGQERHLPHEAWHVVQQREGRVAPSIQVKGIAVNVNSYLETEADAMGAAASRLAVTRRLPSPAQVEYSRQQLGQPAPVAQRAVPGVPVRQFRCPLQGRAAPPVEERVVPQLEERREPSIEDLATERGIEVADLNLIAHWLGIEPAELLRLTWPQFKEACKRAPANPPEVAFQNVMGSGFGEQLQENLADLAGRPREVAEHRKSPEKGISPERAREIQESARRDIVPPELLRDLGGLGEQEKVDTIFERFNAIDFVYTGTARGPLVGYLTKSGDCSTLAEMFQMATQVAGIDGVRVEPPDMRERLVPAAPIHGRSDWSNEMSGAYWWFDKHFWCTYKGTKYDLLFMTKGVGLRYFAGTGRGERKGCRYTRFAGDHYFIKADILKSQFNIDTTTQGKAFESWDELRDFIGE